MTKVTPKTLIRKAYRLLTNPSHWTKGYYARTVTGTTVEQNHPEAFCFCLMGALDRAADGMPCELDTIMAVDGARKAVAQAANTGSIPSFNDAPETTHRDVLKALRRAYSIAGGSRP